MPPLKASDLYHLLLALSWPKFLTLLLGVFISINLIFGTGYYLAGPGGIAGMGNVTGVDLWLESVFFSVQTFSTIGYGRLAPVSLAANVLVTIEAFTGLMGLALATGLLFARFSRPSARVLFSDFAVMEIHDGVPSLVFRLANARLNQIVEAKINVILARDEKTAEGHTYRNLHDLVLERDRSPIFALSWTIVHPITRESPLFGQTQEDLVRDKVEIISTLVGIDDTFAQSVHARRSYLPSEIDWKQSFVDIISRGQDGNVHLDLTKFHALEKRV
jgi:inward rectifier potassium channel